MMMIAMRQYRTLLRWVGVLVLVLGAFALHDADHAAANGVPIRIPLAYLSGLSTWGPQEARGEAELSFSEAFLRVDIRGLPALSGESYHLWLVKSATNKATAAGSFTSDGSLASYTGTLTGLDGYDYDLLMVTVEPSADADPLPSGKRSLGGFFTAIKKAENTSSIISDTQPAELPKTGEAAPVSGDAAPNRLGLTLIAVGVVAVLFTLKRTRNQA
jgi:hypothetical protein